MSPDPGTLDALKIDRSAKPEPRSRIWVAVALVVLLLGGGVAWWRFRPERILVKTVAVQEAQSGGQKTLLNASGYVTARRQATVSSKVTGKVVEVMVEEGRKVKAGDVLARLDSSNVEASLRLAEAQLDSARRSLAETRALLHKATREWQRVEELHRIKIASQGELDQAESDAKSLEARLDRQVADVVVAEREVTVWKQQLDDTIVRAPFDGVVTAKNAQPGEMISPMSSGGFTRTGICTVVDMRSLEVEVDVNESYINRVDEGQPVLATLDSYPDWRIPSKVIAIIPTADRQKATVKVRVGFDELDPRILPDMGVKVAFQSSGEGAPVTRTLLIPKSAAAQRDGRDVVWVVKDGRAERRAVTLGPAQGDALTVVAGLTPGEQIVIEGAADLTDGASVTVKKP
ncbi:MAG TPA: efflux RND transporter periplasmic adaptor subunit [Verrucomicrobiota bacterium]|nr:efflux RND transporter periplasmic adaptor subunit [Verrucomicrobiales bacterium]HRI13506.1 efflux RND transporter periplasmic adaptor subunit [Verrucomicrobiota bacterium]